MENQKEEISRENKEMNGQKSKQIPKQPNAINRDIIEQCIKINGQKSNKVYQKMSFLGKGGFAQCFLTKQKDTQRKAATKIIPKKLLDSHRTKLRLANEIKLHKSLHNENIVEFYNNFQDEENVYINLEVCENGSINDLLRSRYSFTTPEVQSFLYGICHGLKYLHSRNIIHRDLKLGNIFLNNQFKVKIGDFGLACKLQFARQFKRTVCGTPNYIAPQVLEGKGYHFQIDVWAVGVIIYTLFFTVPPFETEQPHTTYQKIRKCQFELPKHNDVPSQGLDLIKRILVTNPANRLTLDQILESPFMKLGGSIPLGLPLSTIKRPPTRKQLANWPCFQNKKAQSEMDGNTTFLGFLGISKKTEKNIIKQKKDIQNNSRKDSIFKIKGFQKQEFNNPGPIVCKTIEQVEQNIALFYMSNGNLGIVDNKNQYVYVSNLKDGQKMQKPFESIKKISINEIGSTAQQQILWNECPHKLLLSIKQKQLLKQKIQMSIPQDIDKLTTVTKLNTYKDILMIRLSNRAIQIIFKQKDGFILSPDRKRAQYFYSFLEAEKGKEINIAVLMSNQQNQNDKSRLNSSTQFTISGLFKSKKNEKHYLTMKKVSYLRGIISETLRVPRKTN